MRARLGIGRANPLAGLAMAMKTGLRKMSPHSSPGAERKSPSVAAKPAKPGKKPEVGTSTTNSPLVLTPTNEARATSTPKDAVPSPLSTPVRRTGGTPGRRVPAANDSTVSDSTLGNMSELFPKGNSRLFGDDEIEKLFSPTTTEEPAEETQDARKNETLGLKAAEVKRNSPLTGRRAVSPGGRPSLSQARGEGGMPEWKRQLQEQRAMKEEKKKNDHTTDSKVAKEATIPDWKKELLRKKKATPEPSPVTKPQEPSNEASPEELTKANEPTKDVTPPKEVPSEDVSAKSITAAPAEREVVAKKQKSPTPEPEKQKSPTPEAKKQKSPTPEAKKQKSPTPEAKKQKSPTPEAKKQKSPTPEAKKQKSPTPEAKKQKSPTPEAKKQKSPTPEAKKQKSPTPEAKKQKSPTPEAEKEKEDQPEPVKDATKTGAEEVIQSVANAVEEVEAERTAPQAVKLSVVEPTISPDIPTVEVSVAEDEKVTVMETEVETGHESVVSEQIKDERVAKRDPDSKPDWKKRLEERHASREREVSPALADKEILLSKSDSDKVPDWKKRLEERRASREREASPVSADKDAQLPKDEERRPSKEERPPVPVMNKEALMAKMEECRASREKEKASVPVGKEALMAKSEESHTSREKPPLPVGKEALLAKTADTEIPEWRRRLLERKKESGSVSVPTKTVAVTSSEPEWKKRAEERRKQREAEKTAASAARAQQKDKKDDDDVREWQKRMQERKEIREREKRAKEAAKKETTQSSRALFDASITEKGPEKKPLFDSSLQADGEKGSPEKKDKLAKKEENKAKIESLFADDDEDILFKSKKSPPPKVEEVFDQSLKEVVESAPSVVKQEASFDSPPQGTESDATALKDWVVVGEEEVKQADKDKEEFESSVGGVASKVEVDKEEVKKGGEVKTSDSSQVRAGSTTAVKNAERKEKRDVKPNDSRPAQHSPITLRKTPSPREQDTKNMQQLSGPSWLDQAKKMREANQSKFQRTRSPASVLPKSKSEEDQEMPEWRKRLLEKRQQKATSSSSSPSIGSKPSSPPTGKNRTASPSRGQQEQSSRTDNLSKRSEAKVAPKVAESSLGKPSSPPTGKNRTASPSRGQQEQSSRTDNLSKRSEAKVAPKAAESSKGKAVSSSGAKASSKTRDEEMPDWQHRLHERKLARQALKEKDAVSSDKPVVKAVEEQVTVKAPEEAPPVLTETKEAGKSSLFDDDSDLPDWKSKLSARKKLLEQKKDELSVPVTSVTEVEQRSSSVPPVDKEPRLKPRLDDKPAFSSSEQIRGASEEFGSRESVSSEGEVFSPVRKTAPDSSDTSCKESTQASQASLISMSDTASSAPRSATISGLDSEEKEETPPPGCVHRASVKFSPTHDSQQQASSGVPRWKKELMTRRKKNLDQDSGSMTGSTSSMDSKGVRCDSN